MQGGKSTTRLGCLGSDVAPEVEFAVIVEPRTLTEWEIRSRVVVGGDVMDRYKWRVCCAFLLKYTHVLLLGFATTRHFLSQIASLQFILHTSCLGV